MSLSPLSFPFSGSAFYLSKQWQPLLVFGDQSYGLTDLNENLPIFARDEYPRYELQGLAQAATLRLGKGRVVLLGEASMCTAQADQFGPFGMNHPDAGQNALFCLNTVCWALGVIDA